MKQNEKARQFAVNYRRCEDCEFEIRTALPYTRCHTIGIWTGQIPPGNPLATQPSLTSMIRPSDRTTDINVDLDVPVLGAGRLEDEASPPDILLLDSDTNNNEVLPPTQVFEPSTTALAVEVEKEDSAPLQLRLQLIRQLPEKQTDPDVSATQTLKKKSAAVRRDDSEKESVKLPPHRRRLEALLVRSTSSKMTFNRRSRRRDTAFGHYPGDQYHQEV